MQGLKRRDRKDPVKSRLPKRPIEDATGGAFGAGKQGVVRGYAPTLSMHLAKQTSYDRTRDEDPREAILRHADAAAANPMFVDTAYQVYSFILEGISGLPCPF